MQQAHESSFPDHGRLHPADGRLQHEHGSSYQGDGRLYQAHGRPQQAHGSSYQGMVFSADTLFYWVDGKIGSNK
jgi:hypothetical protein